jgi:sugar phosphate isomerase/epimerase
MKKSISTNWCSAKMPDGRAISDKAIELGFDELELGYSLKKAQVEGIRDRLDQIPVGSVHAFCPMPLSAPYPHPELYLLASRQESERALARTCIVKNVEFASSVGAKALVLHAGRIKVLRLFSNVSAGDLKNLLYDKNEASAKAKYRKHIEKLRKLRAKRGKRMMALFIKELEEIIKTLEENSVTLSFENLPYLEGFPCEAELGEIVRHFSSPFIKGWLDTGHDAVRRNLCYVDSDLKLDPTLYAGVHVNDIVKYEDDHLPPGYGSIDFSQYADIFANVEHIVFEPNQNITEENLKKGIENYERQLQS